MGMSIRRLAVPFCLLAISFLLLAAIPRTALAEPPKVPEQIVRPLSMADARSLPAAVAGDRLEALFTVALATGLRQSEAPGLQWEDVYLDG
jgi:integrase